MKEKQSSKLKIEIDPEWSAKPAKEGQVAESENIFEQIPNANPENKPDKDKPKAKICKQSEQIQKNQNTFPYLQIQSRTRTTLESQKLK